MNSNSRVRRQISLSILLYAISWRKFTRKFTRFQSKIKPNDLLKTIIIYHKILYIAFFLKFSIIIYIKNYEISFSYDILKLERRFITSYYTLETAKSRQKWFGFVNL